MFVSCRVPYIVFFTAWFWILFYFEGATFGGNYHPGDGFMPSAAEDYDVNLDSGNSIITRHLRAELENRLVMAINCNNEDTNEASTFVDNNGTSDSIRNMCEQDTVSPKLKFPDNLVSVIAGHVIQESSLEPCGLKGNRIKLPIPVLYSNKIYILFFLTI